MDDLERQARCGFATASRFRDILATGKGGEAVSRRNLRTQLVVERLTGAPFKTFENEAMAYGREMESEARLAVESELGEMIVKAGFIAHPNIPWVGCSPDGFVRKNGINRSGVEIKCPFVPAVHLETLQSKGIPSEHVAQVQGGMWVCGKESWVFVSYSPVFPENLRLVVREVKRDEEYIKHLQKSVISFLSEVEESYEKLLRKEP